MNGKIKAITILTIFLFLSISMSGCVGPGEIIDRIGTIITGGKKYEWETKLDSGEKEFRWINMINKDLAYVNSHPFIIVEDTKRLHIKIEVVFSFPLLGLDIFSQGGINATIQSPSGENEYMSYNTPLKPKSWKESLYIPTPASGEWKVIVKARGYGNYQIKVAAEEPVERKGILP